MKPKHIRERDKARLDWDRFNASPAGRENATWTHIQNCFNGEGELDDSYISYSGGGVDLF